MLSAFNLYSSVHENIIKVEYFLSQVLYILSDFSTSHINLKIQAHYINQNAQAYVLNYFF